MSSDPTAAFLTRDGDSVRGIGKPGADREQISLDLLQHRAQVRFQDWPHARRRARRRARPRPRTQQRAGSTWRRACRRTGRSRRCRRSWCRFSLERLSYASFTRANPTSSARMPARRQVPDDMPQRPKPGTRRDTPKSALPLPAAPDRRRFRRRLLEWYRRNGRDLPWRQTSDPYHILVSEVMLQQTQVDRVLPKYDEWLAKYPTLAALAAADESDVSRTWRPLGYNIRPRRLHAIARESVARYGGTLPSDEATLLSFKGIGAYTAGAVRSFAFGQRAAILDTNVARVLFRDLRRTRRTEGARHAAPPLERLADGAADAPRLRLQPGADGLRRDALHGAQAQVPALPDARRLRGLSVQSRQRACGAVSAMRPPVSSSRPPSSNETARSSSPDGPAACTSKACGSFPAGSARPENRSTTCLRREIQEELGSRRAGNDRDLPGRATRTPTGSWNCTSSGASFSASRSPFSGRRCVGSRVARSPISRFPPADAELIEMLREVAGAEARRGLTTPSILPSTNGKDVTPAGCSFPAETTTTDVEGSAKSRCT